MTLEQSLARLIALQGPVSLTLWMGQANAHYYGSRDPLGADGDFTTAPEISQMFGEMIGVWLADVWSRAGSPPMPPMSSWGRGGALWPAMPAGAAAFRLGGQRPFRRDLAHHARGSGPRRAGRAVA
jgi:hypothetical protein